MPFLQQVTIPAGGRAGPLEANGPPPPKPVAAGGLGPPCEPALGAVFATATRAACLATDAEPSQDKSPSTRQAVLALDLGTTTGWAARTSTGAIRFGSVAFKRKRDASPGAMYLDFVLWLDALRIALEPLGRIVYEAVYAHKGTLAAHRYGAFEGHLQCWCARHRLRLESFAVGQIKRHATGAGNAGKEAVFAAMQARGFAPEDDNAADALALLLYALEGAQQ